WYKSLFNGKKPKQTLDTSDEVEITGFTAGSTVGSPAKKLKSNYIPGKYPLPLNKAGKPHIINMRKIVPHLKGTVPCKNCNNKKDCCRDIQTCANFALFDCGDLHPVAANAEDSEEDEPEVA
ncbi:hypothetical protein BBP40_000747, partial [Aspergillus hancockii]